MKAPLIHRGHTIDYTPTVDTPAGTVVIQNQLVGVADLDIKAGQLGSLSLVGIREFPKAAGAIVAGTIVYEDKENDCVTATAGTNVKIGITTVPAEAADKTVYVKIG